MPINSNSYKENDKTFIKGVLLPTGFETLGARDFDTAPTPFSTDTMEKLKDASEKVLSAYEGKSGKSIDYATRYGIDVLIANTLNKPVKEVSKNHDLYVRMLTGTKMDDKGFFEAFKDSWETQDVQARIANLQNRFDYSEDSIERRVINNEIAELQQQLVKLGDYSNRSWLGTQAIAAAPIFNQVVRTSSYALGTAAAFAGLTLLTGGVAPAAGLGMISMGSIASTGATVGTAIDAITNVYAQERGLASRDLYEMVDANDNRMDDKTRRTAASLIASVVTLIEYFTPEPGLGKKLFGITDDIIANPLKKWLIGAAEGALSESIEEGLQSAFGEVGNSVARWYSDKYGTTQYGNKEVKDIIATSLTEGIESFNQTYFPSLLVSAVPGIRELSPSNWHAYKAIKQNEITVDERNTINEKQEIGEDSKYVKTDKIIFGEKAPTSDIQPNETTGKFPTVKVSYDYKTDKYTPVDQYNYDLAKTLYNSNMKAIGIDIVEDGDVTINADTVRSVASDFGGVKDEENNITYFSSQYELDSYVSALGDDVITSTSNGRTILEYIDSEGNTIQETLAIDSSLVNETERIKSNTTSQNTSKNNRPETLNKSIQRENARVANEESDRTKFWNFLNNSFKEGRNQENNRGVSEKLYQKVRTNTLHTSAEAMVLLSRATGLSADEIINKKVKINIDLSKDATSPTAVRRGYVQTGTDADGNEVFTITLTRNANERTLVHEVGHVIRRLLSDEELKAFSTEYGVEVGGTWLTDITENDGKFYLGTQEFNTRQEAEAMASEFEEQFAKDFEAYVAEGKAPTPALAQIFEKMKKFISSLLGSNYGNLNDNLRKAYDNLFSRQSPSQQTMEQTIDTLYQEDVKKSKATRIASQNSNTNTDEQSKPLMTDKAFTKALDEGQILDYAVLQEKVHSKNADVSKRAKEELVYREIMNMIPDYDRALAENYDNADSYIEAVNTNRGNPLSELEESVYRRFYRVKNFPTIKQQADLLLKRITESGNGVRWLKNTFTKTYEARTRYGRIIRSYVPNNGTVRSLISRISETGDNTGITSEIITSIINNPAEWVRTYYETTSPSPLDSRYTVEELKRNADAENVRIREMRRENTQKESDELRDTKGITVGDVQDTEVTETDVSVANVEADEASVQATEAQAEVDISNATQEALAVAIDDNPSDLTEYEQRLEQGIKGLQEKYSKKIKEAASWKDKAERREAKINKLNQKLSDLEQEMKSRIKDVRDTETIRRMLQDDRHKAKWQEKMDSLRKRLSDEKEISNNLNYNLKLALAREKTAKEKLNKYKAKVYIDRKIRSMKRRLSFNNATHDAQYLTTMQYVYYLLNGGQHRRNQTSDIYDSNDYSVQALLSGHSEVTQDGEITFYKTDLKGNLIPNSEVDINTGMYKFDQKNIPKLLADNLDSSTLQKLEAGDALFGRKSTFTTEDFLNLDNALANAKKQAKNILDIKKNQYYENLLDTENKLAKNAAPSIFDAPLTPYAERNMLAYYKVNSIEELTDGQIKRWRLAHPTYMGDKTEIKGLKKLTNIAKYQFIKMQSLAYELDGGKAGIFTKTFFDNPLNAEKEYFRQYQRRIEDANNEFTSILGDTKAKNEKYKDFFFKRDFSIKLRNGYTRNFTGWNLMGIYIYAQNALSFAKLTSGNGNNLTLDTLARINPEYTLKFIDAEIQERADIESDKEWRKTNTYTRNGQQISYVQREYAKTMLYQFTDEELSHAKNLIESMPLGKDGKRHGDMIPAYAEQLGDSMIGSFAKEQERYAKAIYDSFNEVIDFQDRYFPMVKGTKTIGDNLGETRKRKKRVESGSKEARQQDVDYELYLEPMSTFISQTQEQEKLISMGQVVKDMDRILADNGGNLGTILRMKYGDEVANYFGDYVSSIAGEREKLSSFDRLFNRFIGNVAVSKLAANMMTAIRQTLSIIPAVTDGEISVGDFIKATIDLNSNRKQWESNFSIMAPEIQNSTMNLELQRLRNTADMTKYSRAMEFANNYLMKPIEAVDKGIKKAVWIASYNKNIENGMSSIEAATSASRLVQRTQSTTLDVSLAPLQRNRKPWARLMFMFSNDLFQMWNIIFGGIPTDYRNKNYGRMWERIAGVGLSVFITAFLAGGWLPDKDDDEDEFFSLEDFGKDAKSQLIQYLVPIGGQKFSEWYEGWSSPFYSGIKELYATGRMISKSITDDKDYSWDEWLEQVQDTALSVAGGFAPVPEVQLNRLMDSMFPDGYNGGFSLNLGTLILGKTWGEGIENLLD